VLRSEERQELIKVWRRGFMRWRRREGPWGSHQLEARALKCDTSVGSTVPVLVRVEGLCCRVGVVVKHRDVAGNGMRGAMVLCVAGVRRVCETHDCMERAARAGL
jgi:hypothetical protein